MLLQGGDEAAVERGGANARSADETNGSIASRTCCGRDSRLNGLGVKWNKVWARVGLRARDPVSSSSSACVIVNAVMVKVMRACGT